MGAYPLFRSQLPAYSALSIDDEKPNYDSADLLLENGRSPDHRRSTSNSPWSCHAMTKCVGVGLLVILATTTAAIWWQWVVNIDRICLERTSAYSPALKDIPARYESIVFNGSLDYPSIYRGPPSPEVDEAWGRISNARSLNLPMSADDIRRLGKDPETMPRLSLERGGGYMLNIEYTHQLHCVNLLRKVSYWDYYKDIDVNFEDSPQTARMHIDHCIEMLRQFVMCHADVGIVTSHWVEGRSRPYPDFSTAHRCRNFDAIHEWTEAHKAPPLTQPPSAKPDGAKELPSPP